MDNASVPLGQKLIVLLLFAPAGAALVWLLSRGASNVFEGGDPSKGSLSWLRKSFWIQLALFYCLTFGIAGYAYFFR
jgi:hypothetical protein